MVKTICQIFNFWGSKDNFWMQQELFNNSQKKGAKLFYFFFSPGIIFSTDYWEKLRVFRYGYLKDFLEKLANHQQEAVSPLQ